MTKKLLLASFFVTAFSLAFAFATSPAQALTSSLFTPSLGKVGSTPKASITAGKPTVKIGFTLKPRQFTITAKGFKTVQYTIEYQRSGGVTEGLNGGGKVKAGTYVGRHFAGTQSSKYFIPHDVKSGRLIFSGKTLKGADFSYTTGFVVKNGRLTLTK